MQLGDTSDSGQPQASDKPRIFRGWWLVLLSGLVVLVTSVPPLHSMAIWAVALENHFMWSHSQLAGALTISRVFGLLAPVAGYLTDRFGPRRLVLPGLCTVAAGFVIFGLMQDLPTYYASSIVISVGLQLCGSIPLVVMLSHWFVRRRAVAIATYLSIPRVLALASIPFVAWNITAGVGWRTSTFMVAGAVSIVLGIAYFRMRNTPEDMGLQPDGTTGVGYQALQTDFSLGRVLRSRPFWYITLGGVLASASLASGEAAAKWKVLEIADSISLALISGFASFAPVCFYLVGGLAGDRFTKYRVMALFAVIQALGILVMVPAHNILVVSLALVLMSVGAGGLVPLSLAIMPDYFGTGSLGSILGVQGLIVSLVTVLGSANYLFWPVMSETGSYVLALLAPLVLTLLAAFLFLKSTAPLPPSPSNPHGEGN